MRAVLGELKIFSGRANQPLAEKISKHLGQSLGEVHIADFSDHEISVQYEENIRGADIFIVQSTNPPAENLFELLILIDAAHRASANRIAAVIPYYGYSRQDRKAAGRQPITARLVADLIKTAGVDRVLLLDLHAGQIVGFFTKPVRVDHLYAKPIFVDFFFKNYLNPDSPLYSPTDSWVVLAPDTGAVKIARSYAKKMGNLQIAIIDKRRVGPNESEALNLIGCVSNMNVIVVDDLADTGGTLTEAARAAADNGARSIYAACTHPVLSGQALQKIEESPIKKLYVTDSIFLPPEKQIGKIEVLSVAPLFAEAIRRIHEFESVSSLFD